jgi:peptidoglycan/LPS O-acetylase OafA/YrhL
MYNLAMIARESAASRSLPRVPQLDGVRGIAILLVLIWHYVYCQLTSDAVRQLRILRAINLTWSGVDLFFVLSGFLIAGILIDHRGARNYFQVFYVRRACRIFPLYVLVLALALGAAAIIPATFPSRAWLLARPLPWWSYATLTQNIWMAMRGDFGPNWLGITWSLAVEEQFYLVIPLVIYLVSRRTLLGAALAGVLAAPLLRALFPGFRAFVDAPWRADSLLSGVCLAIMVRSPSFLIVVSRYRGALLALFLALLAGAGALTVSPDRFTGALSPLWLALLYATFILIAFVDAVPPLTALLRLPPLMWLGRLAYGTYMIHQAVSGILHGWAGHDEPKMLTLADAGVTAAAAVVTLLLASLSYRWVEGPMLRFGSRFTYMPAADRGPALDGGAIVASA